MQCLIDMYALTDLLFYNMISAMFHTGLGGSHVNSFLAAIEVPGLDHKAQRRHASVLAKHVETVAHDSCEKALREEVALYPLSQSRYCHGKQIIAMSMCMCIRGGVV